MISFRLTLTFFFILQKWVVTVINPFILKDLTLLMPSKYNQLQFTLVKKSKLHLHNYILC